MAPLTHTVLQHLWICAWRLTRGTWHPPGWCSSSTSAGGGGVVLPYCCSVLVFLMVSRRGVSSWPPSPWGSRQVGKWVTSEYVSRFGGVVGMARTCVMCSRH